MRPERPDRRLHADRYMTGRKPGCADRSFLASAGAVTAATAGRLPTGSPSLVPRRSIVADLRGSGGLALAVRFGDGEGVELGEHGGGLGCAYSLEYLVCLPQQGSGLRGLGGGDGAAAQAGQRAGLVPGAGDGAGPFQGLLVALPGAGELTAGPVQRPDFIEHLGLAAPVAEVAAQGQSLLQVAGGPRVVAGLPPHDAEIAEGAGLAAPVAEVAVQGQGLLQVAGGPRVVA